MDVLRIATLNCLNLALPGRRVYEGIAAYTPDEYIGRAQWLAQLFDRLGADLLLLQEVFHARALADVVAQTVSQGRAWSSAAPFADDVNGRPRVALLWRPPLSPVVDSVVDLPGAPVAIPERGEHRSFSRPVLRARLPLPQPGGRSAQLTVLNVHLKSRRPEFVAGEDPADPAARARAVLRALLIRAAEAAGVRELAQQAIAAGDAVIVGGDFNDGIEAVTTRMVADAAWHADEGSPPTPMLYDAIALDRAARGGVGPAPFSILHGGVPERIDHLLVSAAFVPGLDGGTTAGGATSIGRVAAVEVLADHLVERRRHSAIAQRGVAGSPAQPGGMTPTGPDLARVYPDHAPLCATLVLGH